MRLPCFASHWRTSQADQEELPLASGNAGVMASWTDYRHYLLSKAFPVGPIGPIRKLLLRFWARRYPDDFELWCHETGRDPDLLRSEVGA